MWIRAAGIEEEHIGAIFTTENEGIVFATRLVSTESNAGDVSLVDLHRHLVGEVGEIGACGRAGIIGVVR